MSIADEGTPAQEMTNRSELRSVILGANPLAEAFKVLSNNFSVCKPGFSEDSFEQVKAQRLVDDLYAILHFRDIGVVLMSEFLTVCHSARLVPSQMKVEGVVDTSLYYFATTSTSNVKEGMLLSGERVALKSVRKSQTQPASQEDVKRLFLEALISRSSITSHPNIMSPLGIYVCPSGDIHLVSRLQKNGTLPDYLGRHPEADRLHITNILVDDDGNPLLMDLDYALVMDPVTGAFSPISHIFTGNPRYTPYEKLCSTEFPLTLKADTFSFASFMFEVLSGEVPYHYLNRDSAVIVEVLRRRPSRRPSSPQITDPLWNLMMRCWSIDPAQRPSMAEVYLSLVSLARSDEV
ncbi:hypothetical protein H0H92_011009 [Tricholoma furcatifolium]|nr:hypothetical protein H0H92_011009 [Tricholoma furcatifolium]